MCLHVFFLLYFIAANIQLHLELLKTSQGRKLSQLHHVTDHGRTGDEGQQPAEQSLQLLYESRRWVDEDGLQAGQGGQLDALIGTRQGLQQQGQELDRDERQKEKTLRYNVSQREKLKRTNEFPVYAPLVVQ